jgi:hypothetical protein
MQTFFIFSWLIFIYPIERAFTPSNCLIFVSLRPRFFSEYQEVRYKAKEHILQHIQTLHPKHCTDVRTPHNIKALEVAVATMVMIIFWFGNQKDTKVLIYM